MSYVIAYILLFALALHRMQPRHKDNSLDFGGHDIYVLFWQPVWWKPGRWRTKFDILCEGH